MSCLQLNSSFYSQILTIFTFITPASHTEQPGFFKYIDRRNAHAGVHLCEQRKPSTFECTQCERRYPNIGEYPHHCTLTAARDN
jgi:hypothetical protein